MDFHTGIAAGWEIGDTGTSGVKNGGAALGVHRGEYIAAGADAVVRAVAEHIRPAQRAAAAGEYNDLAGKAVAIVDVALFGHHAGLHISPIPTDDAVGTDEGITFYHGAPGGTAPDDLILTHIVS